MYALEFINEDTIASGGLDLSIQIWSISSGLTQRIIKTNSVVFSLKLLSNGFYLACGLENGKIEIYNINDGTLFSSINAHADRIFDLILINNDNLLVSSSRDKTIKVIDLKTNTQKFDLNSHTDDVIGLKQLSKEIFASSSLDTTIKLWNITTGKLMRTLKGHTDYIYWSLDLMGDDQTLVSGSYDQTIKFWNWKTGQLLNTIYTGTKINSLNIIYSTKKANENSSITF